MPKEFIQVQSLAKTYFNRGRPACEALKQATFDIHAGEVLSLLGVNGAGKTTLSTMLASLHPPTAGDITWKGKSIYSQVKEYRSIIGFCPQAPNLHKMLTLEENLYYSGLCYGMKKDDVNARIKELIEQFHLSEHAKSMVQFLSGGYRQRFLIARALVHRPKLVILDEPTVGLDPQIRIDLWKVIEDLRASGVTVILTTHYLDEAERLSDRICFIDEGELKIVDTAPNLIQKYQKKNLEEVFLHLTQKKLETE